MVVAVVAVITAFAVGLCGGAWARAAIFRYATPASSDWRVGCPDCGVAVANRALALRPLALTGACRGCGGRIGPPPGAVELVAAVALAGLAWRTGWRLELAGLAYAAIVGVVLAFVDAAVHRLPDRLVATALIGTSLFFAAGAASEHRTRSLVTAAISAAVFGAVYFVLVFAFPRGLGLGDAKLAVLIGLATGWFGPRVTLYAAFAGVFAAGVVAIALLAARRAGRADHLALGPYMLLGAWLAIVFG